jgi:beta-lactamase family protein
MMRSRGLRLLTVAVVTTFALAGCFADRNTAAPTATTATQPPVAVSLGIDPLALVAAAVPAELTAYLKGTHERAGVAVLDRATGLTLTVQPHLDFQTASIMKVDILATRLLQHQNSSTSLSSHERSLAYAMITESDNNAASALYSLDGDHSGVSAANAKFGMTETTPHGGGVWGMTVTTPADQLALLTAIMDPNGPLNSTSRSYLLNLMSHVDKAQDWGVPAAATSAATGVYVKNGWDTIDAQGGLWGINSIGRIVEPGHDWLVASLSSNHRTMSSGIKVVEQMSKLAVGGLRLEASLSV